MEPVQAQFILKLNHIKHEGSIQQVNQKLKYKEEMLLPTHLCHDQLLGLQHVRVWILLSKAELNLIQRWRAFPL